MREICAKQAVGSLLIVVVGVLVVIGSCRKLMRLQECRVSLAVVALHGGAAHHGEVYRDLPSRDHLPPVQSPCPRVQIQTS